MKISARPILRAITVLTLAAIPALCATITYTTQASWAAATAAGYLTIDFSNLPATPGTPTSYSTAAGVTVSNVNFVGVRPTDYYLNAYNETSGPYFFNSGAILAGPWPFNSEARYIRASLPISITSVGFEVMTINVGGPVTVKLSTNETFTVNTTANTRTFIGFTSDIALSSVQISSACTTCTLFPNGQPAIDNFAFGAAGADTPEIGTLLLIGTGLIAMRIAKKRKWRWASSRFGRWVNGFALSSKSSQA